MYVQEKCAVNTGPDLTSSRLTTFISKTFVGLIIMHSPLDPPLE